MPLNRDKREPGYNRKSEADNQLAAVFFHYWNEQKSELKALLAKETFPSATKHVVHDQLSHGNWARGGASATALENEALGEYTYGEGFTWFNDPDNADDPLVEALDTLIKKNPVPEDLTVYRGVRERPDLTWPGFQSTTTDPERAAAWAGEEGWVLEIRVAKGSPALNVDAYYRTELAAGDIISEGEILLPRGSRFTLLAEDVAARHMQVAYGGVGSYTVGEFAKAYKANFLNVFWSDAKRELFAIILPHIVAGAAGGVEITAEEIEELGGLGVDWDFPNSDAMDWALAQADATATDITNTRSQAFSQRLARWIETPGQTLGMLVDDFYAIYGSEGRALSAATNSITQAYAQGNLAAYRAMQAAFPEVLHEKGWFTNEDEIVCPICSGILKATPWVPVDGQFLGDIDGPGAHYGCRCWLGYRIILPTKHVQHDQLSHGNWARGGGSDPSNIRRSAPKPGQCFETSARWVTMGQGRDFEGARLVQGIVMGQGPLAGQSFTHSWVEIGDMVYDPSADVIMDRAKYYEIGQIGAVISYTPDEALTHMLDFEHWGPWDEDLATYGEAQS